MKKIENYKIIHNNLIAKNTYEMKLEGNVGWIDKPGKFINVSVDSNYLKRPISICDYDETTLTLVYKVFGSGTKWLSNKKENEKIEALVNLGNGFELNTENEALIIGGGVGVPPLYALSKRLKEKGVKLTIILGFTSKEDSFYIDKFKELSELVYISSNDGSIGEIGFVSDIMIKYNLLDIPYYTCGPTPMLKAVHSISTAKGQLSLEERMGCGFGACMGCSHKTKNGYKRVCVEGPVFTSEEIIWND
ncbi:MAG: dihydroorotate dehydrogenase electron transfer subunit [Erysipelotrichaceae bacterium]|nr:dihydroorotate dehydrogenase electron transfer subunit [Erysipelotrichaceae bacterium]